MKKILTFTILFFICNTYALTGIDSLWQEYEKQRQFPKTAFKILDQITAIAQHSDRNNIYHSIRTKEVLYDNKQYDKLSDTDWDRYIKIYNLYANQLSDNDIFLNAHFEMKKAESLSHSITSRINNEYGKFETTFKNYSTNVDDWDFATCRKKVLEHLSKSLSLINLSKEKISKKNHISYFSSDYNYYNGSRILDSLFT